MKETFDWEAFKGCLILLVLLIVGPVVLFVGYFLFHVLLYILPAVVAAAILLAIPFLLWYAFKAMFFKKAE